MDTTTPVGMLMAGISQSAMALSAAISIPGGPIGGHTITIMWIEVTQGHRELPISNPLLKSLAFLMCNRNPITRSQRLQGYPATSNIIFKNSDNINQPTMQAV